MVKIELDIGTVDDDLRNIWSYAEERFVCDGARKTAKRMIKATFLSEEFLDSGILEDIAKEISETSSQILVCCMQKELRNLAYMLTVDKNIDRRSVKIYAPLTAKVCDQLGIEYTDGIPEEGIPFDELAVCDEFIEGLSEKIQNNVDFVRVVTEIREHPMMKNHVLPLLRKVQKCLDDGDTESLLKLLQNAKGDPNLTIPEDEAYLLSFLALAPGVFELVELFLTNFALGVRENLRAEGEEGKYNERMEDLIRNTIIDFDTNHFPQFFGGRSLGHDLFEIWQKTLMDRSSS